MTDEQIKYMVQRFLSWRLPEPWHPDNGISYKRPHFAHAPAPHDWPTGTNLFDADRATAMVRHMIDGMPGRWSKLDRINNEGDPIAEGRSIGDAPGPQFVEGLLVAAVLAERHVPSSPSAAGEASMRRNGQDIAHKIREFAQGIETRRAETEGLGAKPESPVATNGSDAP